MMRMASTSLTQPLRSRAARYSSIPMSKAKSLVSVDVWSSVMAYPSIKSDVRRLALRSHALQDELLGGIVIPQRCSSFQITAQRLFCFRQQVLFDHQPDGLAKVVLGSGVARIR